MAIKVEVIGHVDVDSGTLMIGDPCYFIGDEWADKHYDAIPADEKKGLFVDGYEAIHHNYETNTGPGKGVTFGTAWGDGGYPVIGIWDYEPHPNDEFPFVSDRPSQVFVDTNPSYDENDEYVLPRWLKV